MVQPSHARHPTRSTPVPLRAHGCAGSAPEVTLRLKPRCGLQSALWSSPVSPRTSGGCFVSKRKVQDGGGGGGEVFPSTPPFAYLRAASQHGWETALR
ncbi:unnamed protein product [Merluccius merluccius]